MVASGLHAGVGGGQPLLGHPVRQLNRVPSSAVFSELHAPIHRHPGNPRLALVMDAIPDRSRPTQHCAFVSAVVVCVVRLVIVNGCDVLIAQAQLWKACVTAIRNDVASALFLLPYLVQDVLSTDHPLVLKAVVAELLAVLTDSKHTDAVSAGAAKFGSIHSSTTPTARSGHRHTTTQTVFALLDTLEAWKDSTAPAVHGQLLQHIPQVVLADAALACNASARALRHLEAALRDSVVGITDSGFPKLPSAGLSKLQLVYSHLDEPDGLVGINALRAVAVSEAGGDSWSDRLRERIIDCEHEGRWDEALVCFEQALQATAAKALPATAAPSSSSEGPVTLSSDASPSPSPSPDSKAAVDDPSSEVHAELLYLHSGILRCLHNSGHLETSLQRGVGVLSQHPSLSAAVTPYAVEAAWRLGRWDTLDSLLHDLPITAASTAPSTGEQLAQIELDFGTHLGSVMRFMHDGAGAQKKFQSALNLARLNVMTSLSAASMESYQRCVRTVTDAVDLF